MLIHVSGDAQTVPNMGQCDLSVLLKLCSKAQECGALVCGMRDAAVKIHIHSHVVTNRHRA